ncbi:MAG: hypothetical protein K1X94_07470 [Sandaracinaceae bacterium]|nr:hypothetical protein [Sandaracinaceae bacterium]
MRRTVGVGCGAVAAAVVLADLACTGASSGEVRPGMATWLEGGAIAVEPGSETAYVLRTRREMAPGGGAPREIDKRLFAVSPDDASVREVADLLGYGDVRVVFPRDSILLFAQQGERDELRLLDRAGERTLATRTSTTWYWGTRVAPSGDFVVVADNAGEHFPLHVISIPSLAIETVPHDGAWLEAMWLNGGDRLAAIVFYDPYTRSQRARILVWDMRGVAEGGFATDDTGLWPSPVHDILVPGVSYDFFFSYTWIGVAPDDSRVVFPVLRAANDVYDGAHELLVLDMADGTTASVPDAYGPVAFTPDSSSIVSYRYADQIGSSQSQLLLIDAETLEVDPHPIELPAYDSTHWPTPTFFVSHAGHWILIAGSFGDQQLVLFDTDANAQTQLGGPTIFLGNFASRDEHSEIWISSSGLHRLDLETTSLETIPLDFELGTLNILPRHDWLVLSEPANERVHFWDPDTRTTVRTATLR